MIEIDIRWEDDGEVVEDLLVSQYDGIDEDNDDVVFYNGLSWQEVQECIENKTGPAGSEFVIIAARLVDPYSCDYCGCIIDNDRDFCGSRCYDEAHDMHYEPSTELDLVADGKPSVNPAWTDAPFEEVFYPPDLYQRLDSNPEP